MWLPVLTWATKGGCGDEDCEGHQQKHIDEEYDKVHVKLTGRHMHKHHPPGHYESHVLNGNDCLQQAEPNSNAQNCCPREGDPTSDQLHQVGGMSQKAGETESKENTKEKVAHRGSLLTELENEGKSKAKEPQHTQEEEELCREDIPLATVLNLSYETEKCQEQNHCNHYADYCQALQNNAP